NVFWWIPIVFWVPIICFLMYYSIFVLKEMSTFHIFLTFLTGNLIWPFLEYFLHRFIYHLNTESYWANTIHFLMHGVHHLTPMDKTRLVAPPPLACFLAIPISSTIFVFSPNITFSFAIASGI